MKSPLLGWLLDIGTLQSILQSGCTSDAFLCDGAALTLPRSIMIVVIVGLNTLPVRFYGETEFWFASLKVVSLSTNQPS